MKIKSLMLIGLSTMLSAACSSGSDSDEIEVPETKINVSFVADIPGVNDGTRTSFDKGVDAEGQPAFTPVWSKGEKLSVLYGDNLSEEYAGQNSDYAESTEFFGSTSSQITTGHTIVAITKALNLNGGSVKSRAIEIGGGSADPLPDSYTSGKIQTVFKNEQEIATGKKQNFDENAEILVSAPVKLQATTSYPVALDFKRYNGIICLQLFAKGDNNNKLAGTQVKEISLTTGNDADNFGGDVMIDVNAKTLAKSNGCKVSVKGSGTSGLGIVAGSIEAASESPIYISVLPTQVPEGQSLKIYLKTSDGRTYERVLPAPAGGVSVPAETVTTFALSLGDKHLKVKLKQ